jgi:hypothetical protein
MLEITVLVLILHTPGNHEVSIVADKIVSLREGEGHNKHVTGAVNCVINTDDGKFIGVIESCEEIRKLMK